MATLQDGPTTTTPGISRQASSVHISMDQIESTHARENPAENLQSLLANFRACGSSGSTSSHMKPVPTEERLRELAQDYVLPKGVGLILDAEIQLATATAIVTALFSSSLFGLMQVTTDDWIRTRFWHTAAAILNLQQSFFSILIIKQCAEVPYKARLMVLSPSSWPSRVANGEALDTELLTHPQRYTLLTLFGMSNVYKLVRQAYDGLFLLTVLITMSVLLDWLALEQHSIMPSAATWATIGILLMTWELLLLPFYPALFTHK